MSTFPSTLALDVSKWRITLQGTAKNLPSIKSAPSVAKKDIPGESAKPQLKNV